MSNYVFVNSYLLPSKVATSNTISLELPITEEKSIGFVQESPTIIIPQFSGVYQVSYDIEVQGTSISGIIAELTLDENTLLESVSRIIPSSITTVSNIKQPITPTLNLSKSFMMYFTKDVPISLKITAVTPFQYRIRRYSFSMSDLIKSISPNKTEYPSNILMAKYLGPVLKLNQRHILNGWRKSIDTGKNFDNSTGKYKVFSNGLYEIVATFFARNFPKSALPNQAFSNRVSLYINETEVLEGNGVRSSDHFNNFSINAIFDLKENDEIYFVKPYDEWQKDAEILFATLSLTTLYIKKISGPIIN